MTRHIFCPRLLLYFFAVIALVACAEERPEINRVQPNALAKQQFTGEWYYVRTVVDVPSANGFTFVGHTDHSGMTRVTWEIQEDYLYARRTTELIKGADGKDDEKAPGDDKKKSKEEQQKELLNAYKGEVVAAYRIERHFDIVNAYNPTTGEQLNILEENTSDRPWYEREYIRVDWSANKVHNYALNFESWSVEPVPYYVQAIDPASKLPHPDAPYFEVDGSYFDVTNKIFAKAGTIDIPGYGTVPLCWLSGEEFTECGAGEYTIRNSFKKIDPNHQYEPLPYKGKETEVFGFFWTDRMTYDPQKGILNQHKERYMNRHNLWYTWYDKDKNLLPPAQRLLKPIVYHVNRDFPEDLKDIAREVARQWNETFTKAVVSMGHTPNSDVFILCENNPVKEGDPIQCGGVGNSPRLGDIRYSFMAYVPKYMTYGLLGLGPSNNDPETGEIISGMGYVYHHNNLAAYRVQEMLELLNGARDPKDFIDGVDLGNWVEQTNGNKPAASRFHGLEDAQHMVNRLAGGPAAQYWASERQMPTAEDEQAQHDHGFDKWIAPYVQDMYERGIANGEKRSPEGKLARLKGTYLEDLLLDDEVLMAGGHTPGTPVTEEHRAHASVARGGLGKLLGARSRALEKFAADQNMYMAEMADDALIGLAKELQGADPATVYNRARKAIYTAVLAHEVGHSLGLMHNFGGSDDAINYDPEYWKLRDDGNVGPRLVDPITPAELDNNIYNYAYSSVMDYAGRYTIDGRGIGSYDRAAIMFGYARKMEVFKDTKSVPANQLRDWYERDGELLNFGAAGPQAVHYTSFYNRMGPALYDENNRMLVDVDNFKEGYSIAEVDGQTYSRVPYIYCSHSRANLGDSCLTRDYGADAQERMKNFLDELNTWYITRAFPRGKVGSDHYSYVGRWYGRIYNRLKKWHDIYGLYMDLLPRFYPPNVLQTFLTDPVNGWGDKTWGVQNAFNYLVQTLLTPDIGNYGGPFMMPDGNTMMIKTGAADAPLKLDVTNGRYFSTSWGDGERECGYMFWECLHHVGHYLDKIMAIEALSDTRTNFVARATPEDLRQWEISYYTSFPEQLNKISTAMMGGDWKTVGPYLQNGELKYPNYTGPLSTVHNSPVDPFATFSVQLYWQVLGKARFFNNFDQSFVDDSRVWIAGTGTAPDMPAAKQVSFNDPLSGITYAAIKMDGRKGSGQAVLDRANKMKSMSNYCDDGATPTPDDDCANIAQGDKDYVTPRFLDHVELVKVMADLSATMTHENPYP